MGYCPNTWKEKKLKWDEWKWKTRAREHKDLQLGQISV